MIWRAVAVGCVVLVAACGGASVQRQELGAGGTEAAGGSAAGSVARPEAGAASGGAGGSAGLYVAPMAAGEAGAGGEPSVPSEAGAGGEVDPGPAAGGSSGGATGGSSSGGAGGSSGSAGAGGRSVAGAGGAWAPPDPDCKPSNDHALPLKCMPPQPIDCRLPEGGNSCTGGYGKCPSSDPSGLYCHPSTNLDYSLCPPRENEPPTFTALLKSCPKGTCGTAAGAACRQTMVVAGKYEYCPCVQFGSAVPYPCGENGTTCPPGVSP